MQNRLWAELGQAQRVAMQFRRSERGPYVWDIVRKEAIATTLGLLSIILILGANVWVWLAIVVGNLVGVYRTYSKLTKDSHSTAHDLVEMLELHQCKPNENTAKFITLLREIMHSPPNKMMRF